MVQATGVEPVISRLSAECINLLCYTCMYWYTIKDSNLELTGYKPGTLTVELMVHKIKREGARDTRVLAPLFVANITLYGPVDGSRSRKSPAWKAGVLANYTTTGYVG